MKLSVPRSSMAGRQPRSIQPKLVVSGMSFHPDMIVDGEPKASLLGMSSHCKRFVANRNGKLRKGRLLDSVCKTEPFAQWGWFWFDGTDRPETIRLIDIVQ